jgi:hypothetical protein
MSELITGVAERSEIRSPSNTEHGESGDFIATTVQPIANNIEWHRVRTPGAADEHRRDVDLGRGYTAASPVWTRTVSAQGLEYWAQSSNATNALLFDITPLLPHICTITGFAVAIDPAGSHVAMPTMPVLTLMRRSIMDSPGAAWTTLSLVADPSTDLTEYEAPHVVGRFVDTITVDKSTLYRWALSLEGEVGANHIAGLSVVGCYITVGP